MSRASQGETNTKRTTAKRRRDESRGVEVHAGTTAKKAKTLSKSQGQAKASTPSEDVPEQLNGEEKSRDKANTSVDEQYQTASPEQLKTILDSSIKLIKDDLSTIELEDESLPVASFADTTSFSQDRTVSNLSAFLEHTIPGGEQTLKKTVEAEGSPHTLLITGAAIRAQALLAEVRKYGTESNKIAKLFAKHMKLKDHVAYVEKTKFGIGAGSPHRIQALIETEVLKISNLKYIVLDGSFVDGKQRTIFTDKESFTALLSLLNQEALKVRLASGKTKILVF